MAEEAKTISSCLTDNPVNSVEEDNLRADDYANALAKFIKNAATPVTIGIQGGWGSGKTSLITVLKHKLDSDEEHPALCVVVNAWQHSLFQAQDDRAQVVLSLLSALSEGLTKAITNAPWLDKEAINFIEKHDDIVEKTIGGLRFALAFASRAALQMASNVIGGGDISSVKAEEESGKTSVGNVANSVRELQETLSEMIKKVTFKGKPVKIVFFIDDLDRVPPSTAIEILDTTKNIFDFPQCVFVLAIDYEVVVKGLEKKFGPKTPDNEREFRQYFDKIIQIPFTMPIGAYGDNLSSMLKESLTDLGYMNTEEDMATLKNLAQDAKLATGGIPRSIKRIINTLSLLMHISSARQRKGGAEEQAGLPPDIEPRFIVVALHINFPEIARRLMQRPNFTQWTPQDLDTLWNLKYKENEPDLKVLEKDNLFNDPWEKVVYCLASGSPWLKTRARNISQLMNNLLASLGGEVDKATEMPEDGLMKLQAILKGISVVSIDSTPETQVRLDVSDIENHAANKFFVSLQNALAAKLPDEGFAQRRGEIAELGEDGDLDYSYYPEGLEYIEFNWNPAQDKLTVWIVANKPGWKKAEAEPILQKARGSYELEYEGKNFYYFFEMPMTAKDLVNPAKVAQVADETVNLYKTVKAAQKILAEKKK